MDALLAIASKRDVRAYADRPLPEDVERRILDAGRLAGSSRNSQPWRFHVLASGAVRAATAESVWAPGNVEGAALVVAVVVSGRGPLGFDAGRAAQNMMLAAWDLGVASCPNGVRDPDRLHAALGLGEDESVAIVLSLGYPARAGDPLRRTVDEWSARADRRPLDELVVRR
jgi:nitroreductase